MKTIRSNGMRRLKLISGAYFICIAAISLFQTFLGDDRSGMVRDTIILLLALSPLLVNKRLYYLAFGLLSALVSFLILLVYVISGNPAKTNASIGFFLSGVLICALAVFFSLGFVHVGTYSKDKNKFRLL